MNDDAKDTFASVPRSAEWGWSDGSNDSAVNVLCHHNTLTPVVVVIRGIISRVICASATAVHFDVMPDIEEELWDARKVFIARSKSESLPDSGVVRPGYGLRLDHYAAYCKDCHCSKITKGKRVEVRVNIRRTVVGDSDDCRRITRQATQFVYLTTTSIVSLPGV